MPEYLSPGVYVEEIDAGPKPIEGVSTSTAGVRLTDRGPSGGGPPDGGLTEETGTCHQLCGICTQVRWLSAGTGTWAFQSMGPQRFGRGPVVAIPAGGERFLRQWWAAPVCQTCVQQRRNCRRGNIGARGDRRSDKGCTSHCDRRANSHLLGIENGTDVTLIAGGSHSRHIHCDPIRFDPAHSHVEQPCRTGVKGRSRFFGDRPSRGASRRST